VVRVRLQVKQLPRVAANPREMSREDVKSIIEIAKQRAELIRRLRAALEGNDTLGALRIARRVCGLPEEETAH